MRPYTGQDVLRKKLQSIDIRRESRDHGILKTNDLLFRSRQPGSSAIKSSNDRATSGGFGSKVR
jgi:hypothetical protein